MTILVHYPAKTKLELAVERFEQRLKSLGKQPNADQQRHIDTERAHIRNLAQITQRLEEYYGWVEKVGYEELFNDKHDSERLGRNMRAEGRPKPTDRHDAHAIVSGGHEDAIISRIKLAECQIGIDEGCNGAWLPRSGSDAKASTNWATPKSVPHSRTHRKSYYTYVNNRLRAINDGSTVRNALRLLGRQLEYGALPPEILEEMRYDELQNS